jgi:predicted dinucleotide-binding enzyme
MLIGILGAGRIGQALAGHFVKAGHELILANSRGPSSLASLVKELGPTVRAGTAAQAAGAPIVFLAVMWPQIPIAVAGLGPFEGRIVVDTSNPYRLVEGQLQIENLGDRTSSEVVADFVPGARLVKACNTLYAAVLASDPREAGGRRVLFLSGDDQAAKAEIISLFDAIGFAPIDLGSLALGGRIQQGRGPLMAHNLVRLG